MPRTKMNKKVKWIVVALLVICLALVRAFEDRLFYDPFSAYFKNDYLNLEFPDFETWRLFASMTLRYLLNTVFSLAIIQVLFEDFPLTQFAAVLYAVFFTILICAFFAIINWGEEHQHFVLFYVRRFLIQPLLVLLFVPAFYYQRLKSQ